MKTIRIAIIVLATWLAFACNNQQSNEAEGKATDIKESPQEKPTVKTVEIAKVKDQKLCESMVREILITSPRYKQLTKGLYHAVVKNGGQSFGLSLESSPNPKQDNAYSYSKTYNYRVFETYPDRQLNTVRFSFNPSSNKLSEYDEVHNQLKAIMYDTVLLVKYNALCK